MADDLAPETSTAVVEAPDAPIAETESLADHEAVFGAPDPTLDADAKAKNDEARATVRHRAKSQAATPEDVAAINQWTARAKAAEDAAGIAKLPNESERVYRLRVRAELAERHGTPPPAAPAPSSTPAPSLPSGPERGVSGQLPPTRTKPSEDDIGAGLTYQTYGAYVEDLTDWKAEQLDAAREAKQQQESQQRAYTDALAGYHGRLGDFVKTHADFDTLLAQYAAFTLPPAVYKSVLTHDNGPAFVYHLLQHPDQLADVVLLFDGKPPSNEFVALATHWLSRRTQAVVTGSAAPAPSLTLAARPPNPVRTGPSKSDGDLPGDDASLADHEKAFGKRLRR